MGKVSNALTMASMLSSGKKYSIIELSAELEVTPRMIRTYKEDLEKAGIYIDSIRGPYGGYVLNQSVRFPKRKFDKHDVELLKTVIKEMNHPELQQDLILLMDKVRGIYQGSQPESHELKDKTLLKYNVITKAIKEKRKVKILYYSYDKGESERIVRPYDMFLFQNGWGFAAFCELRQDLRHFELNRIRELTLLDEKFD